MSQDHKQYELMVGKALGMSSGILAAITWNSLVQTALTAFLGASVGYFTTLFWNRLRNRKNK